MTIFKLLRIQQWIKNILLFVPILSVGLFEKNLYFNLTKSFIFFSLFVSGTYILNDLTDIESDKLHPTKNKRPIASGQISTKKAYFSIQSSAIFNFLLNWINHLYQET